MLVILVLLLDQQADIAEWMHTIIPNPCVIDPFDSAPCYVIYQLELAYIFMLTGAFSLAKILIMLVHWGSFNTMTYARKFLYAVGYFCLSWGIIIALMGVVIGRYL